MNCFIMESSATFWHRYLNHMKWLKAWPELDLTPSMSSSLRCKLQKSGTSSHLTTDIFETRKTSTGLSEHGGIMRLKQCHFYQPWLGMVGIPPIKNCNLGDGKNGLWHCFTHITHKLSKNGHLSGYPLVNKHRPWESPVFNGNESSNPYLPGSMLICRRVLLLLYLPYMSDL